jgi:hypothetical protein
MTLKRYDENALKEAHGDYEGFRKLYKGQHHELFQRAQDLLEQGELFTGRAKSKYPKNSTNVKTPYLAVNVSKVIVDTPVMLINNSLGKIISAYSDEVNPEKVDEEEARRVYANQLEDLEEAEGEINKAVGNIQQKQIDQITDNSDIDHQKLLTQLHIDGGIVGVPEYHDGRIEIVFKERNVYNPIDKKTEELAFIFDYEGKKYVHSHTEKIEAGGLRVTDEIFRINHKAQKGDQMAKDFVRGYLGIDETEYLIKGRQNFLFVYLPYNPTFMDPLGVSVLEGQADKQEEINWTLTRAAQTFERNGKPRISVPRETMQALLQETEKRTGQRNRIDHQLLEVTTKTDKGGTLEYHQIDISKIGNMDHVKEIIKAMLMESQTSIQAVDFVSGTSGAASGRARFYDWATSVLKAGEVRTRYVEWLQKLYENALWLANHYNNDVIVERPHITMFDIAVKSHDEKVDEEIKKYAGGVQSLETTVKNIHPNRSEKWIMEEIERIEEENENNDTMSLLKGSQTARQFNDNKPLPGEAEGDGEGEE